MVLIAVSLVACIGGGGIKEIKTEFYTPEQVTQWAKDNETKPDARLIVIKADEYKRYITALAGYVDLINSIKAIKEDKPPHDEK